MCELVGKVKQQPAICCAIVPPGGDLGDLITQCPVLFDLDLQGGEQSVKNLKKSLTIFVSLGRRSKSV